MPDKSDATKRAHPISRLRHGPAQTPRRARSCPRPYAELRCKSNFSFLRGASHPEELVERAAKLGYAALAVTDRNTLAGVVRMHCVAKSCGLKLIIGAELTPVDSFPITLYAPDRAGYGRLSRIITQGRRRAEKGACIVTLSDIAQHASGLLAAVHGECAATEHASMSASPRGLKPAARYASALNALGDAIYTYRDIFGDRLYLAVSTHGGADDRRHLAEMAALARETRTPMLATNDAHYHEPQRRFLQDVLTCVRQRCTLEDAGRKLFANAERHLKPIEDMERLFADYPRAITRTAEIAERCTFSLDELRYEYPKAICPEGRSPRAFLSELTWAGARRRYPAGIPDKVRTLIKHELALIGELAYEPYFLTVWDIVKFARSRDILCQGRGSAANSVVCYCLGITSVDPGRIDLLFERFVSAERNEPPDIDVDFEHERREEVFQYIYGKYGRDHAGIVAEVITYRPRSAIRDVGKALGLSLDHVSALSKKHEWWDKEALPEDLVREIGFDPSDRTLRMLRRLVRQLVGFPRHLSQHVGGFVITRGPLSELVPIENAAMPNRTFIEWDKDDVDALGMLKIDCLALGMLTAIRKCFDLIEGQRAILGELCPVGDSKSAETDMGGITPLALHTIPQEDPAVYDMICRSDTVGIFQIESRAQMSMLPRLKPRKYYDLVIEVAIVRPGPIQGGMVHPYLRRRNGEEAVTYPNEAIKEVLSRTLGVPIFQEQAMRLAVVAAGFTPGESDQLRRAMGAWRRSGAITRFRTKLIEGMKANGLAEEFAERCFKQISGFGEYGFPESHAASFALLVYVSAWLKRYHPAAFCTAIINAQPMGFYQPAQLVRDAREHGVEVLPIDVNFSGYDCRLEHTDPQAGIRDRSVPSRGRNRPGGFSVFAYQVDRPSRRIERRETARAWQSQLAGARGSECRNGKCSRPCREPAHWGRGGPAVRLGMRLVKGISHTQVDRIERARCSGRFTSVTDLLRRSGASRATLVRLAAADAMQSLGLNRREALWDVLALGDDPPMFERYEPTEVSPNLPALTMEDTVYADYDSSGLSLNAHPISLIRGELRSLRVEQNRVLQHARDGQWMRVAGLVLIRQRPSTALGIIFCTLEDETGIANLVIRPKIYDKYRRAARGAVALLVEGRVERKSEVVHLQVARLQDVSHALAELGSVSRDFH